VNEHLFETSMWCTSSLMVMLLKRFMVIIIDFIPSQ